MKAGHNLRVIEKKPHRLVNFIPITTVVEEGPTHIGLFELSPFSESSVTIGNWEHVIVGCRHLRRSLEVLKPATFPAGLQHWEDAMVMTTCIEALY